MKMYLTVLKPILDIIASLIALPFLLISVLIVAPIIYFTDRGPIFYSSYRMGKNGRRFIMHKFRSMYVNAPDVRNPDGSLFNSDNDERLTKIGRFIRKTSIDELPQLINILCGDMSLVGPRPSLYNANFPSFDEKLKKRFAVKPGLTGYAQAYFRNSIDREKKFEYDAWYVDNISFMLDAKIILKTFHAVAKRKDVFVNPK